eukprot:GEMP01020853.1.p1 GENE.GEMP01020853.1~~GEMP01020853.1.p1  ORF type:complete len:572 (+),score=118.31 GEMP01020853.1:384-2099(+)
MLSEYLFRRILGVVYAVAFASFLGTCDGMFACTGLVPVESRLGIPLIALFIIGVAGLLLSVLLATFNLNITLLPLWLLFLACNVIGTELLFFREYDILLLEVGLYAALFSGEIGQQMSSWALFRYAFAHAKAFFTCAGSSWAELTWFKLAFTTPGPLPLAWHFAENFSPLTVKLATAFVMVAFVLSGLGVGPLRQPVTRYVFWAAVLYKGAVQNAAWIPILIFALTTHMQSENAVLGTYPRRLLVDMGAVPPPDNVAQGKDDFGIVSLAGIACFVIAPALAAFGYLRPADIFNLECLMCIGALTLGVHLLCLFRMVVLRKQVLGLLAGVLSAAGFVALFHTEMHRTFGFPSIAHVTIPGVDYKLTSIPVYGHPVDCPEPEAHTNMLFGAAMKERGNDATYVLKSKYSVAEDEAPWTMSMPFPPRLEEALVQAAKTHPHEMPAWMRGMLLQASVKDPNVGQLFDYGKFRDVDSVFESPEQVAYIYILKVARKPTNDLRGHTWWSLERSRSADYGMYKLLETASLKPPACPPPTPWAALPLRQACLSLALAALLGKILLAAGSAAKKARQAKK